MNGHSVIAFASCSASTLPPIPVTRHPYQLMLKLRILHVIYTPLWSDYEAPIDVITYYHSKDVVLGI
jgi:hypothetical protein